MTKNVTVVDYGIGNLYSVARALEAIGANVDISASPDVVAKADRLLLPGVGSFAQGMAELKARGLDDALREYVASFRPFLGICLGMQLLFDSSEEFGNHQGLGFISGKVLAIPSEGKDGVMHKIPHIGWAPLMLPLDRKSWAGTILENTPVEASTYFVHSFTAFPDDAAHRLADCDYDGCLIAAAVQSDQIIGCQFHPEKSGKIGLEILRGFLEI